LQQPGTKADWMAIKTELLNSLPEWAKPVGIYHSKLGQSKLKEALPKGFSDGRLTLAYGEYYLVVSEKVQPSELDNQGRMVALDPGVRTFMTFISEDSFGWLGNDSNLFIQKLCFRLDKLTSKMSKSTLWRSLS